MSRDYFGFKPRSFLPINWKILPTGKENCIYRWSYKNSCFSELMNNSSVLVLMIWSFKYVPKNLTLDFMFLVLKLVVRRHRLSDPSLWNWKLAITWSLVILLQWDESKHGLSVTQNPKTVSIVNTLLKTRVKNTSEYCVKIFLHHHQKMLKPFFKELCCNIAWK